MIRIIMRTKYIILLVILLVVFIGTWFYKTLYVSTGYALQRAENFLFTRMTVAQLDEQRSTRYFYATNRQEKEGGTPLENHFGNEREARLKFGFYDTKIEPSVGLGEYEQNI